MPESFKRMYGPGQISTDAAALTTLFTVPTGKTYVVRDILQTQQALVGPRDSTTMGIYYIDSTPVCEVGGALTAGAAATQKFSGSIPVHEGQSFKGYVTGSVNVAANLGGWNSQRTYTAADANTVTTGGHASFDTQPNNPYWVCWAMDSPDTISTTTGFVIVGNTVQRVANYTNIVAVETHAGAGTAASQMVSIGGTVDPGPDGGSNSQFGVTATPATGTCDAIAMATYVPFNSTYASITGTGTTVAQTATGVGTTSTTPGVTMTPLYSNSIILLAVSFGSNVASDWDTAPANYTQLDNINFGAVGSYAANYRVAAYKVSGANGTNPTVNLTVAPVEWAAVAVEFRPPSVATTVTGIVID